MKILHIGLAAHYTESMNYQDEIMPRINASDGHDVTYISDNYEYVNGKLRESNECDCVLKDNVRLIRLKFNYCFTKLLSSRLLKTRELPYYLESISPDVILYHGFMGYGLIQVTNYIKKHSDVLYFVDCHATFDNSSRNILSKTYNKVVNGFFIHYSIPYITKIFYVGDESKEYLSKMYKISDCKMEWLPLGGNIYSISDRIRMRNKIINKYSISRESIIFSHSGKINKSKKTIELLRAFQKTKNPNYIMFIIGSIEEDVKEVFSKICGEDSRIIYVGWKQAEELLEYLLASDVYCQPGTVSATFQNALCCGCAVMIYPWKGYLRYDKGDIFWIKTEEDMVSVFGLISDNPEILKKMQENALSYAQEFLDYSKISKRIYKK